MRRDEGLRGGAVGVGRRFGAPPVDERQKGRQVRFLMARGYSIGVALKVVRGAVAEGDVER